jgi:hypothetical protein
LNAKVSSGAFSVVALLVLAGLPACSSSDPPSKPAPVALATGSTCPDPDHPSLTYSNWAQYFFASYCTRCHSSTLDTTTERNGAPPQANWDDLSAIRTYTEEIDSYAAGGPNGINYIMPPSDPKPSDDERTMLGEWLACGAPE